jgi:hypothetical protein
MRRTERRVLVLGAIVFLLGLTAIGAAAAAAGLDGSSPAPSLVPGSPAAFAERAVGGNTPSFRNTIELMVLVAACGLAAAVYSASGGGQSGKRVLMRIRRR